MSARYSLDVLNVPSPCTVPWKSMTGTDRVRHCTECVKNVYNLSAMTADEANALLESAAETPCVRFYRRFDGTVVTSERCDNRIVRTWRRFTATVAAMLVGLASLVGCDGNCFMTQGKLATPRAATSTTTTSTTTTIDEAKK